MPIFLAITGYEVLARSLLVSVGKCPHTNFSGPESGGSNRGIDAIGAKVEG